MSPKEKRIREACRQAGIKVTSLVWSRGGWLLNGSDPIGYSADEAVTNVLKREVVSSFRKSE